jgi:Flp pilus assembly protein TadD
MDDFSIAIRLNVNDDRAYFNRGCICGRNGDDLCTVRDFSEVIRLNPTQAMAYVNRAVALYNLGYHQGAISDLQKAADLFVHQGDKLAYEKSLHLLKIIQQEISSVSEVG